MNLKTLVLAVFSVSTLFAQIPNTLIVAGQNTGTPLFTRSSGKVTFNCAGTLGCSFSGGVFTLNGGAGTGGSITDPGSNGIMIRTALNTTIARALAAGSTKVTITNADGTAGNPTVDVNEANFNIANMTGYSLVPKLGASNTFSTGTQDFTGVTALVIKTGAGYAPTVSGSIGYDTTANAYKFGVNGATKTVMFVDTPLPNPSPTALGGVNSKAAVAHNFLTQIGTDGSVSQAQPAFTDISGSVAATQMPALTGDVTTSAGAVATTLATVNANVGACGDATHVPQVTLDAKGRATGCTAVAITASGDVTGAASSTTGGLVTFADTTGKALATGPTIVTTISGTPTDTHVPTEAAVKAAINAAGGGNVSNSTTSVAGNFAKFADGTGQNIIDAGVSTASFIAASQKASANGVASLDAGTKIPIAQIPTGTTSSTVSIGNHTHVEGDVTNLTTDLAAKQPLDQDLTDIAAVTRATGSVLYGGAAAWLGLAPNTTTTKLFLTETGTGTAGQAPGWNAIANGDVPNLTSHTFDNSNTVNVATNRFAIQDPTDSTKQVTFAASGITTGTTRTITVPNANSVTVIPSSASGGNFLTGYDATGTATTATKAASDLSNGVSGTGAIALVNTPTLVTPVLGAATATSINKVGITAPATSATLTLANGSTLATSGANSLTLTTTGATNVTLPTSGTLMTTATGVTAAQMPALTGDVTTSAGTVATTLATVNSTPGSCGDASHVCVPTIDGKGRITSQTTAAITAAPGGADTAVQYNDAGTTAGDATNFSYNKTTHVLTVKGGVNTGDGTAAGTVTLSEVATNGSNAITLSAPASLAASLTYTYPDAQPTAGQVLAWGTPSAGVTTGSFVTPLTSSSVLAASNMPQFTGGDATTASSGSVNLSVVKVNGTTVPTNSAANQTLVTTAAATGAWTALPDCSNASTSKLLYNVTTHLFSCGTDQSGSATSFSALTTSTNTTATMTVGAGASIAPTDASTGIVSANQINGTSLAGLATGVLYNTTTTGIPSVLTGTSGVLKYGTPPTFSALVAADIPAALTSTTSVNKVTITAPATSATLTIANGKTLTANNTLTFAGTDSTTMTFPSTSATIARTDAANTFTGHQTIEGVTSTGATGTGKFVFDTSPTVTGPVITSSTVASLPAASGVTGQIYVVTDGASAGSCTSGGGSSLVLCRSNGTSWVALGDGNTGGSGVSVTTKGDLQGYSTTAARIPVGTDGQVLTADSTQALGLKWATSSGTGCTILAASGDAFTPGFAWSMNTYPQVNANYFNNAAANTSLFGRVYIPCSFTPSQMAINITVAGGTGCALSVGILNSSKVLVMSTGTITDSTTVKCNSTGVKTLSASTSPAATGMGTTYSPGWYYIVTTSNETTATAKLETGLIASSEATWLNTTSPQFGSISNAGCLTTGGAVKSDYSTGCTFTGNTTPLPIVQLIY